LIISACHRAGFSPTFGQETPDIVSSIPLVAAGLVNGVLFRPIEGEAPRVEAFGGPATRIRQVLCTEYDVGVGIGWHRDKPHFDRIFGLSLGSACKFRFRRTAGKTWDRFTLDAEPRSLYMMSGASRHVWEHSIPAVEAPRYSITFRTMSNGTAPWTPA
jgi:hypothetical protein